STWEAPSKAFPAGLTCMIAPVSSSKANPSGLPRVTASMKGKLKFDTTSGKNVFARGRTRFFWEIRVFAAGKAPGRQDGVDLGRKRVRVCFRSRMRRLPAINGSTQKTARQPMRKLQENRSGLACTAVPSAHPAASQRRMGAIRLQGREMGNKRWLFHVVITAITK